MRKVAHILLVEDDPGDVALRAGFINPREPRCARHAAESKE